MVFLQWWSCHRANSLRERECRSRQQVLNQAGVDFDTVDQQWEAITSAYRYEAWATRQELETARRECKRLGSRFTSEQRQLEQNKEVPYQFLKTQFLVDFDIPKIGVSESRC